MIKEIGEAAMLEMAAEEAAELTQVLLKAARIKRGENPTPMTEKEVNAKIREEYTDFIQCAKELNLDVDWNQMEMKRKRFEERWKEAKQCQTGAKEL